MNQAIKRGARVLVLSLAAALLLACAAAGRRPPSRTNTVSPRSSPSSTASTSGATSGSSAPAGYAGLFVEDGSDKTVSDVFCIRVKNTGSSDVQYAHITLSRGSESYEFDISTLPAGETLQALEVSGQTMPEKPAELTAAVTSYAPFTEPLSMHEDLFTVTTSESSITVTNNSGSDAAQVYVYYKNASGDLLLGGITYRAGLTNLAAGESRSCYTSHYSEGSSKLLFVTYAS